MVKAGKFITVFVAALSAAALIGVLGAHRTYASTANPSLSFSPRCVSNAEGVALFEVVNNESDNVTLSFTTAAGSGSQTLTSGRNAVFVPYQTGQSPDVTFTFGSDPVSTPTTQAQVNDQCTDDQVATIPQSVCVNVNDASNLRVVWNNDSQITIVSKGGRPACQTVTLYYSTYQMPDNYDGRGFLLADGSVNPTAIEQHGVKHHEFTIKAGDAGVRLENVPAPDYCYNTQADVYYGPAVTNIGGDGYGYHGDGSMVKGGYGHGAQNIKSQIFSRDASKCAGTPGMGGGNGSTTTPTGGSGAGTGTPVTITTSTPAVLPNTGVENLAQNILSTFLTFVFAGASLMTLGIRALRG